MKKITVAIFAIFYLAVSSGFTVHLHYCMNKLAGWNLIHLDKDKCGVCGMHKSKASGCCKDEHKFFKNNTDQKTAETAVQPMQVLTSAVPVSFFETPANDFPSVTEKNPVSHAPPRSSGIAVYIRNCVFLI